MQRLSRWFCVIVPPLHTLCRPLRLLIPLFLRGCLPFGERAQGDGLLVHYRLHGGEDLARGQAPPRRRDPRRIVGE